MRDPVVRFFGTGFGSGYAPVAPGLFGSVVGLGYWWLLDSVSSPLVYWLIWTLSLVIALWSADRAAISFNQKDPSRVVIDELVAVPLALLGLGNYWWEVAAAFILFRVFDVWKPGIIRRSQNLPGGYGIVCDDLLAGLYACATCHAIFWVAGFTSR